MKVLGEKGIQDILAAHKANKIPLDTHLLNIKDVINKHSDAQGFDKLLNELKNPSPTSQKGIAFQLDVMRREFEPGKVKKFDLEFEDDGLPCVKCRFDLEIVGDVRLVEFKSWKLTSIRLMDPKQLKNYLGSVSSIGEFKYYFNKLETPNVADVKLEFKKVFNKDPEGIFNSMKPTLRESLGVKNLSQLKELINDINSDLYGFIEVK